MAIPKKLKKIIVIFLVIVVVGLILLESTCRERMVKRSAFSYDLQTAIDEGLYINGYFPLHSTYITPNRLDTITFDSAWLEHSYELKRTAGLCICEHKVKGDSYNFCAPFNATNYSRFKMEHLYPMSDSFYDLGSSAINRFDFGLISIQDTFKIKLTFEQTSGVDTVYFVKKENSR